MFLYYYFLHHFRCIQLNGWDLPFKLVGYSHLLAHLNEVLMVSYCDRSLSVVRRAESTIALKAYSSYTPGPVDSKLGRKHRGRSCRSDVDQK